jgi:hypothetical protein
MASEVKSFPESRYRERTDALPRARDLSGFKLTFQISLLREEKEIRSYADHD